MPPCSHARPWAVAHDCAAVPPTVRSCRGPHAPMHATRPRPAGGVPSGRRRRAGRTPGQASSTGGHAARRCAGSPHARTTACARLHARRRRGVAAPWRAISNNAHTSAVACAPGMSAAVSSSRTSVSPRWATHTAISATSSPSRGKSDSRVRVHSATARRGHAVCDPVSAAHRRAMACMRAAAPMPAVIVSASPCRRRVPDPWPAPIAGPCPIRACGRP